MQYCTEGYSYHHYQYTTEHERSSDTKGFCQVKTNTKSREKLGSGFVGQAATRILFFKCCVFFCCFFVVLVSNFFFNWVDGWMGGIWLIRVFLGFFGFFELSPYCLNRFIFVNNGLKIVINLLNK